MGKWEIESTPVPGDDSIISQARYFKNDFCFFNKTKYFRLHLSEEVGTKGPERDLREI